MAGVVRGVTGRKLDLQQTMAEHQKQQLVNWIPAHKPQCGCQTIVPAPGDPQLSSENQNNADDLLFEEDVCMS